MLNARKGQRKGQSTVEYIILVSAVLAVAILFLTNSNSGFQKKLGDSMNSALDHVNAMKDILTNSHNAPVGQSDSSKSGNMKTSVPLAWWRCPDGSSRGDRAHCPG